MIWEHKIWLGAFDGERPTINQRTHWWSLERREKVGGTRRAKLIVRWTDVIAGAFGELGSCSGGDKMGCDGDEAGIRIGEQGLAWRGK